MPFNPRQVMHPDPGTAARLTLDFAKAHRAEGEAANLAQGEFQVIVDAKRAAHRTRQLHRRPGGKLLGVVLALARQRTRQAIK
jgi:hypothetical protein